MSTQIIEVSALHKRYGKQVAVEDVSFTVDQGEIFGIVGPNGAGKTTTVECIEGLRKPDGGFVNRARLSHDDETDAGGISRRDSGGGCDCLDRAFGHRPEPRHRPPLTTMVDLWGQLCHTEHSESLLKEDQVLESQTVDSNEALGNIAYMRGLIEQTRGRVAARYGFFLLWGVVWVAGYLATAFVPPPTGYILWVPFVVLGMVGSTWLGMRMPKDQSVAPTLGTRLAWMNLALVGAFICAPLFLGDNFSYVKDIAYIPAAVGVIYAVNGIFVGREMILIGAWLVVAAGASLAMGPTVQLVWMAIAGGGSMILTGLLLRRQLARSGSSSAGVPSAPSTSGSIV